MKIDIYSQNGEKNTKKIELNDNVFNAPINRYLIEQYIYVHLQNTRQGTRSTKGRSDIAGTTKKLWANNKIGRARAGAKKSNIQRSGGVSHGPKPKFFKLSMPKKMRRAALYSSLSLKASEGSVMVLDQIKFAKKPLTSQAVSILEKLNIAGTKTLIVANVNSSDIKGAFSNIQKIKVLKADFLNAYDVENTRKLLFIQDSIDSIPGYLLKTKTSKSVNLKTEDVKHLDTKNQDVESSHKETSKSKISKVVKTKSVESKVKKTIVKEPRVKKSIVTKPVAKKPLIKKTKAVKSVKTKESASKKSRSVDTNSKKVNRKLK
ncbi:MAG: 50S ribosomal protein L4 [Patescibacteria group bacterium]